METSDAWRDQLSKIVGNSDFVQDELLMNYSYDDIVPKIVVLPKSVQEMQNLMSFASAQNLSVLPTGSGTKLGIGNYSKKPDFVLSTIKLNNIIEYEPADLTVTVEAGMRLSDLQTELAKHSQFFPINPPYPTKCTIGGIISSNSSGPIRLRYGTSRNLVLGMKVVHANSTVVKSGGKVVKNVAGYDLNKLYIGAYGTLGVITEVSLKLAPEPKKHAIIAAQYKSIDDAIQTGLNIVSSQTLPSFVNITVNNTVDQFDEEEPILFVGFGGESETVAWQLKSAQTQLEQNCVNGVHIYENESVKNFSLALQDFPAVDKNQDTLLIKIHIKRTNILDIISNALKDNYKINILLGNGVIYLKKSIDPHIDYQLIANSINQLRQKVLSVNGNLIIEESHPKLKQIVDVWGPIGTPLKLMKQLKTKFDSGNILNPGRFVSEI